MNNQIREHKINLTGTMNTRDLGGYPLIAGGRTKPSVVYRSDSLHDLTTEDILQLKKVGVTLQIDLRSQNEAIAAPSKLIGINGIHYINISMLDHIQSSGFTNIPPTMTALYCELLEQNQQKFAELFKSILSATGITIINCTAGKDRTGVASMLLLELVQATKEAILYDYSISAGHLTDLILAQKKQLTDRGCRIPDYIFLSEQADMLDTVDYLKKRYGSAKEYLVLCGMTELELAQLVRRVVEIE